MSTERGTRSSDSDPERSPLIGIAFVLGGIAALALLVVAIEPLRTGVGNALSGDTEALRAEIRDLGFGGVLIVLGLALAHAVVWYPAEILDTAAGFVYGFWPALVLVHVGWIVNAAVSYEIGRHAARPVLHRLAGRQRFERLEAMVERGGATLLLGMRLIPVVPFSLFSMAAGAARVDRVRFIWTTAVGFLPLTALFVYLGTRLESLSPTDPVVWIGAIALIAALLLTKRIVKAGSRPAEAEAD